MNPRRLLLELLERSLRAVDGETRVAHALRGCDAGAIELFAIGKAAGAMMLGASAALGDRVRRGLLITKDGHVDPRLANRANFHVMESAHPVPDERSLAAGAELARRLDHLAEDVYPVFLVSGGSSSLVESLHAGRTLADLQQLNHLGLGAGWDIARLNAQRAGLSRLKAGGVARLLDGRPAHALFISDVPGDDPDVIGSGLLGVDAGKADRIERLIVANIETAMHGAREAALAHGLELETCPRFSGDAQDVALEFLAALRHTAADGLVWGGESTVTLSARPGRGGRNQHLALSAARAMRASDAFTILAAGTDGTDGPTDDAGAIVDARTIERAGLAGVDVERALLDFDSGLALEAAGDLIHTGPTGTNVGDLLIGIKQDARRFRDPTPPRML
jgi:glycerate 2-kinase